MERIRAGTGGERGGGGVELVSVKRTEKWTCWTANLGGCRGDLLAGWAGALVAVVKPSVQNSRG